VDEITKLRGVLPWRQHCFGRHFSDECEKRLAEAHADSLKLLSFDGLIQCFGGLLPLAPCSGEPAEFLCTGLGLSYRCNSRHQANVKRYGNIDALEVVLGIEICWICDHPPPAVGGVDIPYIVTSAEYLLRRDLLKVHYLRRFGAPARPAALDVSANIFGLALRALQGRDAIGRSLG
jgi:hypothetical protein